MLTKNNTGSKTQLFLKFFRATLERGRTWVERHCSLNGTKGRISNVVPPHSNSAPDF